MRSWVFGSSADCDVVVDSPLASGRHCQLTQHPDGFTLDDLGSTNGTYVNGNRITSATRVKPGESITLGRTVPLPWPPDLVRYIRIGRLDDNEIVLDDPRVSGHHARLIVVAGLQTLIEDLGSSNGTFLNSADQPGKRVAPLAETDTVYFGSLAVPAARLLAGRKALEPLARDPVAAAAPTEPRPDPAAAQRAIASVQSDRWILPVLAQAPSFGVLIVLIFGPQAGAVVSEANWESVSQGIASTVFALVLAAIWLGGSIAVGEFAGRGLPWPRLARVDAATSFASFGSRLAVLVSICGAGCALLLAIVHLGSGLRGPWLPIWGMLFVASVVGLLFGLMVAALNPDWQTIAAILLLSFVSMIALGGRLWPLPEMSLPLRLAAAAMPSRWAFEGVLLLESAHHPPPVIPAAAKPANSRDLAEDFFPADSEQMGTKADAMALASMLIGLAAVVAMTSSNSKPDVMSRS